MPDGSKSFWSCPDITIGTIRLKKRQSTRTLPFIFRGSIRFLELTTIQRHGRNAMAWTAKKLRPTFLGKPSIRLREESERPRNPERLVERPGATLRPFSKPSPSQDIS